MLKKSLPLIILIIITIAFFYKVIFLDYVLVDMTALSQKLPWSQYLPQVITRADHPYRHSDSSALYFPIFKFYAQEIKKGNLPLWMPVLAGGYPIYANSTSLLLNPLTILALALSPINFYSWSLILKLFLASLGMYLYLRLLKLKVGPALLGAIVYAFNSLVMLKLEIPWMTQVLWSIPFIFYFLEKTFRKKRIYFALLAALFLSLQFIGGHPQIGLYVAIFAFLYILSKWLVNKPKRNYKLFLILLLPFILLPLLSACQLLPMIELQAQSHRAPNELPQWTSPLHLLPALVPKFLGSTQESFQALAKIERNILRRLNLNFPAIALPYIGLVPLLFGLAVIFKEIKRNRYIQFFGLTILALVILHLTTPLWSSFAQNIPLINKMWNTYRLNILYVFSFAVLSAWGLNLFYQKPRLLKKILLKILTAFAAVLGFCLLISLIFSTPLFQKGLIKIGERFAEAEKIENILPILQTHLSPFNSTLYLPLILLLIITLVLVLFYQKRIKLKYLISFLFVLTLFDLFYIGWFYNPMKVKAENVYPDIPPIKFLKQDKALYRVSSTYGWEVIFPNSLAAYNLSDIGIEYNIYSARYNEYMSFVENSKRASLDNPFHTNLWLTRYNSPLLDIFNVKYIITPPEQIIKEENFALVYDQEIKIYENKKALPRAYLVPHVTVIQDKKEILNYLNSSFFDPLKEAVFEKEPSLQGSENLKGSTLAIVKYEPEEIEIRTDLTNNGFLILTDNYYPGWEVYVDGEKGKIYPANYISRGVELTPGEHRIIFKFKPLIFKIGLYISSITLGFIVILTLISSIYNKKEAGH